MAATGMGVRLIIVCLLLGGFAFAFAEVALMTKGFSPSTPCSDGTTRCMAGGR
jgi:hypothetical protein